MQGIFQAENLFKGISSCPSWPGLLYDFVKASCHNDIIWESNKPFLYLDLKMVCLQIFSIRSKNIIKIIFKNVYAHLET